MDKLRSIVDPPHMRVYILNVPGDLIKRNNDHAHAQTYRRPRGLSFGEAWSYSKGL